MKPAATHEGADHRLRLADGRTLGYCRYGAPGGAAVIALHGTPGSRIKYAAMAAPVMALGLELIAPDRWGYGLSEAARRPSLAAYAEDVRALADDLGLDRFALFGVSGGGPYAAAAAALLGSRVTALALVGPVGPIAGAAERPALDPFHVFCFMGLARVPGAMRAVFSTFRMLLAVAPDQAMAIAMARSPGCDRDVLRVPGLRDRLADTFQTGLSGGAAGPAIDLKLFSRPWAVPLADIVAPTRLWLGTADRSVPQSAALALARAIPSAETTLLDGEGHFWIMQNHATVLRWLAQAIRSGRV
jgi:pimeloyl-ACP methyl ester carboxylesterase